MEKLSQVYDVLTQLSSKKGFKFDKYTLKTKRSVQIRILATEDGDIEIDFISNRPVVSVKKIFTIKIDVLGISLHETGGVVRLDSFPDIPFSYNEEQE